MKCIIHNQLGRRIWLTLIYDVYNDIITIALLPKQGAMHPDIELYDDLLPNQTITLGQPPWSEKTKIVFDDTAFDVKPHRHTRETKDADGIVRIFLLKLTNGVH